MITKHDLATASVMENKVEGNFYFCIIGPDGRQLKSLSFGTRAEANEECVKALKIVGELFKRKDSRIVSTKIIKDSIQ